MDNWQIVASLADGVGTGLFVVMMALGRIIPRSTLLDQRHQYERETSALRADRDEWRDVARRLDRQLDDIVPALRATQHLVDSLPPLSTEQTEVSI